MHLFKMDASENSDEKIKQKNGFYVIEIFTLQCPTYFPSLFYVLYKEEELKLNKAIWVAK